MQRPDGPPELRLLGGEDTIFRGSSYPRPFEFNADVAHVFDDMVRRSIPLYRDVTQYACQWAEQYYQPATVIYDIGCSTGTAIDYMMQRLSRPARFVGIDQSAAMIAKAREKIGPDPAPHEVRLVEGDAVESSYADASVVIANYTLQFIPVARRRELIARLAKALVPGGIVFISEKVRSASPEFQETVTTIYERFKAERGYSESEIARKKEALENVLVPLTEDELKGLLTSQGFAEVESVIKWNNFVSIVARKGAR